MQLSIIASRSSPHQNEHAIALMSGLERHGHKSKIVNAPYQADDGIVACWGWRMGQVLAEAGRRVLVMERGYIGDRFSWTSLGWDGLNGRAKMPEIDDPTRFNRHFSNLLEDRKAGEDYVLLIGQVPRDAALGGRDLSQWYLDTAGDCKRVYGLPTVFRPHPKAPSGSYPGGLLMASEDLVKQMSRAAAVVTYNSNTGVEATLAGLPTIAFDEGSMAWDVTAHELGDTYQGDRQSWANRMAWKQWSMDEIANGTALAHVLEVM